MNNKRRRQRERGKRKAFIRSWSKPSALWWMAGAGAKPIYVGRMNVPKRDKNKNMRKVKR